jgi:hypothetical protein
MAIKGWVVHKVNRLFTRVDLPPRATPLGQAIMRGKRETEARGGAHDSLPRPQQLGAYAPLVAAIRDELEQFVASHVRMHLAIAERDRYLLTSRSSAKATPSAISCATSCASSSRGRSRRSSRRKS